MGRSRRESAHQSRAGRQSLTSGLTGPGLDRADHGRPGAAGRQRQGHDRRRASGHRGRQRAAGQEPRQLGPPARAAGGGTVHSGGRDEILGTAYSDHDLIVFLKGVGVAEPETTRSGWSGAEAGPRVPRCLTGAVSGCCRGSGWSAVGWISKGVGLRRSARMYRRSFRLLWEARLARVRRHALPASQLRRGLRRWYPCSRPYRAPVSSGVCVCTGPLGCSPLPPAAVAQGRSRPVNSAWCSGG